MNNTVKLACLITTLLFVHVAAWAGGGRNRVVGSEMLISPARGPIVVDGKLDEWDESQAKFFSLYNAGGAIGKGAFDDYSAKVALQYDLNALYIGVWCHDPTPLGSQTNAGCTPPGDGLILSLPFKKLYHVALWKTPGKPNTNAMLSVGKAPLSAGIRLVNVKQGFKISGPASYTQEVRIPWADLGGSPDPGQLVRMGVELCFGGLDPTAGYHAWFKDMAASQNRMANRWGGNMAWGFMDGLRSTDLIAPSYDPNTGALVTLSPVGTKAPPDPAVIYGGNELTRTTSMVAVPVGKWDDGAATTIASEPTLFPNRYATTLHWSYDTAGLYMGLRWHTGGPHININDPASIPRGYDGGDDLQIRLATDRVSQIDTWYCDAAHRAAMNITYGANFNEGNLPDAIARGARMAIAPQPGGGYTQEIFLPWSLITTSGKPLTTGDSFRVVLDLFYSGVEGNRIPFIINARFAQPTGVVSIPVKAIRDGYYTVVVDRAGGQVVRRLLSCQKIQKGQLVADWDGLDDAGKSVPAGKYTFRGLYHTGIGLKYLMTYDNPGTPPWQTDDGTGEWGGDHSSPQTVAIDDWGVFIGWPGAEDGNGFVGCDANGKKRWGFFQTPLNSAIGSALLASDGRYLYYADEGMTQPQKGENELAYFKSVITCVDRTTGQRRGFSVGKPYNEIAAHNTSQVAVNWEWDLAAKKNFSLDTYAGHDSYFYSGHCVGGDLTGLAARDGKLYVSLRLSGQIVVYSAAAMQELARWPLAKPGGLAFSPSGQLYAVSGNSIVRVDTSGGALSPVVTTGLEAPVGVAVDAGGSVFISDWGAAQCVKVFSADGHLLRTIGRPGGRAWVGAYDPNAMLLPRGIAVDRQGRLWVAEDDDHPSRVSVWDAATGKLMKEFIGGTIYGGVAGGIIDPKEPNRAISLGVLYDIDLARGGYHPLATMWRRTSSDAYFGFGPSLGEDSPYTFYRNIQGHRLIVTTLQGNVIIGELRPDNTWLPRAAIGSIFNRGDNGQVLPENKLLWRMAKNCDAIAGHGGDNYIWTDLNGDGLVQPDEIQWRKQSPAFPLMDNWWGPGMLADDMSVYVGASSVTRLPFQGWTASGAPRYDIDKVEPVIASPGDHSSVAIDKKGDVLTTIHGETTAWGVKNPSMTCFGPDGKIKWQYPSTLDAKPMGSIVGDPFLGPVDAGGELGEIFSLSQWHGLYCPLITTDGLYVGRVLRDPAEGGAPGPDVFRGETVQYLNRLDDGRIILSHGKNAHNLLQVMGLDTVRRFGGAFELTGAQAAMAVSRLEQIKSQAEANSPIRIVSSASAPKIDGKLDDWDWSSSASIGPKTGFPRAEVALRTDDKALFVAYKVSKGRPFLNNGQDATQLFLTGDAVDLQIGTDPTSDPHRRTPVIGDERLLISKLGDKPVAVLFQAQLPFATNPVSFRSPVRTVTFDGVAVLSDAQVAIVDTPDGYTIEASIPWKDLMTGFTWPGRVFRGDAGIIVADTTGRRIARVYRFNRQTHIVNDVPTEAQLSPSLWGEIEEDSNSR